MFGIPWWIWPALYGVLFAFCAVEVDRKARAGTLPKPPHGLEAYEATLCGITLLFAPFVFVLMLVVYVAHWPVHALGWLVMRRRACAEEFLDNPPYGYLRRCTLRRGHGMPHQDRPEAR